MHILKKIRYKSISGITYDKITDLGLHYTKNNQQFILEVDNIVLCAGQEPYHELFDDLNAKGVSAHLIGGALIAKELDAKLAIEQGFKLAMNL